MIGVESVVSDVGVFLFIGCKINLIYVVGIMFVVFIVVIGWKLVNYNSEVCQVKMLEILF